MINIMDFLDDCKSRGMTPQSIATYRSNVNTFLQFVGDPLKVNNEALRSFLNYLKYDMVYQRGKVTKKGVSNQTVNAYFSAISTFYDYLIYTQKTNANLIIPFRRRYLARIKTQFNGDNSRQIISIDQMRQLINMDMPIQHRAILLIFAKTGIRHGELDSLEVKDLNLEKRQITLKPKAKRTNRLVFFDDETAEVIKTFLEWRAPKATSSYLFISPYGKRLHRDTPNKIVAEYARRLGLHDPTGSLNKKLSPHCFRHFFTTIMRKNNMPREFIQEIRGDRRNDAIDIYDHIDVTELNEMYLECVPKLLERDVGLHMLDVLPQPRQSIPITVKKKLLEHTATFLPHHRPVFGEITVSILSLLKDNNEGLTKIQIVRHLKRNGNTVESNVGKNFKRGYLSRAQGKYFITPTGADLLEVIKNGTKKETPIEPKKADLSKNFLNYVLTKHPELVNNFCNENDVKEKFALP